MQLASELWKLIRSMRRLVASRSDRFLDYNPAHLRRFYAAERPVSPFLSYTLVADFIELADRRRADETKPLVVLRSKGDFTLSSGNGDWGSTTAAGFSALRDSGRINDNEALLRVSASAERAGCLVLDVQRAHYHDQARSNLILDFDRNDPAKYSSLRTQLLASHAEELPPLSDRRLANTLGAAALIFYRTSGQWVPYLVRRVKKIGVFPGGIHCSASGAVKWPAGEPRRRPTFESLVTRHMLDEINEELGLDQSDLEELRPVAFCREMARGGKPQIFYCARTGLSRAELAERRRHAAQVARDTKQWKEIERDRWYRSADVVLSPSRLRYGLGTWGVTLEGAASLFFGLRYLKSLSPP